MLTWSYKAICVYSLQQIAHIFLNDATLFIVCGNSLPKLSEGIWFAHRNPLDLYRTYT